MSQDPSSKEILDEDDIPRISVTEASRLLAAEAAVFVDVRDPASFAAGHIPGALHVNDHNLSDFLAQADPEQTHIIYCYHGYSSLGGAAYLLEQGFRDVASLDGGFADWRGTFPTQIDKP